MSWRDELEPDWVHDAPFYLAAAIAHGALLTLNPMIRFGSGAAPEKVVPIEFVSEVPGAPTPAPPPPAAALPKAPAGDGSKGAPKHGPGRYERPLRKAGAVDASPKPVPKPKPAAARSKREKAGATVDPRKAMREQIARSERVRERREKALSAAAETARRREAAQALAADKAAQRARVLAERKAEKDRVQAERLAERERLAAEERAAQERRAAQARAEAERRAREAREAAERRAAAEAERARALAEAKAAQARKRAEVSRTLATMDEPDEALDGGPAAPASGRGSALKGKPAKGGAIGGGAAAAAAAADAGAGDAEVPDGAGGGQLAGARKAGAAAALAESTDPGDEAGSGGSDPIDAPARGGGEGAGGEGVGWAIDGPVGDRRILSRIAPASPDWVAKRALDLSVTVRFQVLPDGSVKPGAVIQKTSGFPEIDRRALDALRRWRFEAVPAKAGAAEVWGRVTFRFTS